MKQLIACSVLACAVPLFLEAGGLKGLKSAQLTDVQSIRPENLAFETAEDGTRFISLRLSRPDASAVRIHIAGMRLGTGQKLFLSSGDGSQTYGPFEGAGPVQSGELWSEAIAGSEIVVEFQAGAEIVPDLPFAVEAIEKADLSDVPAVAEVSEEDEQPVYEGDILIGNNFRSALVGHKTPERSAVAVTGPQYRWPNGVMPYLIASGFPNQARITNAIAHWNTLMAGVVQMVPRTTETNYVVFLVASSSTCSSYIGRMGYGSQPINVGAYCSTGNIIHEIGHAFGLWHEHTREDRDSFVKVNWANIQSGQSHNFTQNIANGDDLGVYDYASVMHYNATAFSANGASTIETIPAGIPIGQRSSLSTGDIAAIHQLYPSTAIPIPPPPTVPVTPTPPVTVQTIITSNPSGAEVVVDGVNYSTPATFDWAPGSTHTVAAVNGVSNGMRTTFSSWSDGGSLSHIVTASAGLPMLKVDYVVAYSLKVTAVPTGSVYISPAQTDGFNRAGSSVGLIANAISGYCFSSWTGLIEGTPNRAKVTVTRPYDLKANFVPGSISLTASSVSLSAAGAIYSLGVSASSGCTWGAHSSASWASVTSGFTGSLSGTVTIQVAANSSSSARSAMVSFGRTALTINQAGAQ